MRCCGRSFAHSHNQRNHEKTCTSKVLVSERIEPVYTSVGVSGHLDIRSRIADSRVREVFGDGCVAEVIQEDESDMCSGTKGKEVGVLLKLFIENITGWHFDAHRCPNSFVPRSPRPSSRR